MSAPYVTVQAVWTYRSSSAGVDIAMTCFLMGKTRIPAGQALQRLSRRIHRWGQKIQSETQMLFCMGFSIHARIHFFDNSRPRHSCVLQKAATGALSSSFSISLVSRVALSPTVLKMHVIQALRSLVFISVTFRSVAAFAIASEPPSDDDPIATPVVDPKKGTAYATFVPVPGDNSKRSLSQVRRSEPSCFHDTSAFLSPSGYSVTHSSLSCAINGAGYLTYVTLKTYSPSDCASICDNAKSCKSCILNIAI